MIGPGDERLITSKLTHVGGFLKAGSPGMLDEQALLLETYSRVGRSLAYRKLRY
jgi:hypothetical protein